MATIIASQAVISGVFSLTRQAIQLGHLSRMTVRHTSATAIGQIYIPRVNWLLMAGVLMLVVGFGSSGNLAAAYGISVTGAMAIDAVLAGMVAAWLWGWGPLAALVFGGFFLLDFAYFAANALKIPSGGWLPLAIAAGFAATAVTWRRGRRVVRDRLYGHGLAVEGFLDGLDPQLTRVPGTAVFLTGDTSVVPMALLHNIRHNQVVHQKVILLTVRTEDVPHVPEAQRLAVEKLGKGFHRVTVGYGFMDEPDVPRALERCRAHAVPVDLAATSYFVARETLIPSPRPGAEPARGAAVHAAGGDKPVGHGLLPDPAGPGGRAGPTAGGLSEPRREERGAVRRGRPLSGRVRSGIAVCPRWREQTSKLLCRARPKFARPGDATSETSSYGALLLPVRSR